MGLLLALWGRSLMRRCCAILVLATTLSASSAYVRQRGPNCTESPCYNAENFCGKFTKPCHNVARAPSGAGVGPGIWLSVKFEFHPDGLYKRVERGSLERGHCEQDDPWLQVEYEGMWEHSGPSKTTLGSSLATIRIASMWLKLLKERVCLPVVDPYDPLELRKCFETHDALKLLCPCNGWDWKTNGVPRERNIGMFCAPAEQCPLLHNVYLQQNHYLSYNATDREACLSKANLDKALAWDAPVDEGCTTKDHRENCIAGRLASLASSRLLWLPQLLMSVAALLSRHSIA